MEQTTIASLDNKQKLVPTVLRPKNLGTAKIRKKEKAQTLK